MLHAQTNKRYCSLVCSEDYDKQKNLLWNMMGRMAKHSAPHWDNLTAIVVNLKSLQKLKVFLCGWFGNRYLDILIQWRKRRQNKWKLFFADFHLNFAPNFNPFSQTVGVSLETLKINFQWFISLGQDTWLYSQIPRQKQDTNAWTQIMPFFSPLNMTIFSQLLIFSQHRFEVRKILEVDYSRPPSHTLTAS